MQPSNGEIDKIVKDVLAVLPDTLRPYVFNYMPARMLDVHDPETVQVIGRDEVYKFLEEKREKEFDDTKIRQLIEEHTTRTENGPLIYPDSTVISELIVKRVARYAILSHRWLDIGEIIFGKIRGKMSFEDLQAQCNPSEEVGLMKLRRFCETALRVLGCPLAWADTCCIDKTSSSELDEAIRSMFRWYRSATVCIIYLAGTTSLQELEKDTWFGRGWTLQELLAPPCLKFFSKDWQKLHQCENDKLERDITQRIERRTSISESQLRDFEPGPIEIVRRMSWAADRVTTRIEDRAYSLIGIFDVNLIIAYGEGKNAFSRLMEVIYNKRPHYEVFLWEGSPASDHSSKALPASPVSYLSYHDLHGMDDRDFKGEEWANRKWIGGSGNFGDANFTLTNRGLRIKCIDVWVTLRCDPVRVGDKWKLTLRPWHPLSRDIEDVIALVDDRIYARFVETPERYSKAIAVLDYLRNESDRPGYVETTGRLVGGHDHFGWLLMCETGHAGGWFKVMTFNTVRLRFGKQDGVINRPLILVNLRRTIHV